MTDKANDNEQLNEELAKTQKQFQDLSALMDMLKLGKDELEQQNKELQRQLKEKDDKITELVNDVMTTKKTPKKNKAREYDEHGIRMTQKGTPDMSAFQPDSSKEDSRKTAVKINQWFLDHPDEDVPKKIQEFRGRPSNLEPN